MTSILARALPYLACPDDGASLELAGDGVACGQCRRAFAVHGGNVVELLPLAPAALPADGPIQEPYAAEYERLFREPFAWKAEARGWGDAAEITAGHRFFKDEQRARVRALVPSEIDVLADVSGGSGFYFLDLASRARLALCLDLDVASINHVHRAAAEQQIAHVLFVRCDYLKLPLARARVDVALCLDTLLRGAPHDPQLVARIADALKPNGIAVMDIHHRRPGLATVERRSGAHTYGRGEFDALIRQQGLKADAWEPLGFLPAVLAGIPALQPLDRVLWRFLPPIRWLTRARRA